jgi:two-component system sensor histidine kinase YesM
MAKVQIHQHMFSLKSQIRKTVTLFFILLFFFMGLLILLSILRYQGDVNTQHTRALKNYADTLDQGMQDLDQTMMSIYSSSTDFQQLPIRQRPASKWTHIYRLLNTMKIQEESSKALDGMLLYTDSFQKDYYLTTTSVSARDARILVEKVPLLGTEFVQKGIIPCDTEPYFSELVVNGSTALGGFMSLKTGFPGEPDPRGLYGILYKSTFYFTGGGPASGKNGQMKASRILTKTGLSSLNPGRNERGHQVIFAYANEENTITAIEILPKTANLYINRIHVLLFAILLLMIPLTVGVYRFLRGQLETPLEDMTQAMERIQEEDWSVSFQSPNHVQEIEDVRQAIHVMLNRIETYRIQVYEEQLTRQETKLQYLRLRLTPHFYTNCLKNVYYMLKLHEYDSAEQFVLHMSTHLRYLLRKDVTQVTVKEEVDFVLNYLEMQKLLRSAKIEAEIKVPESVYQVTIPILLLQTFVENTIKYGRDADGNIHLVIMIREVTTEEGHWLDAAVADKGNGYPEDLLRRWNQKVFLKEDTETGGIVNLLCRLQIYYGQDTSWYFRNDNGAVSEILIPMDQRKEEDNECTAGR